MDTANTAMPKTERQKQSTRHLVECSGCHSAFRLPEGVTPDLAGGVEYCPTCLRTVSRHLVGSK